MFFFLGAALQIAFASRRVALVVGSALSMAPLSMDGFALSVGSVVFWVFAYVRRESCGSLRVSILRMGVLLGIFGVFEMGRVLVGV